MKIAFDGKRAVQNFTGLGNYSRYVIEALLKFSPENSYIIYAPRRRENNRLDIIKQSESVKFVFPNKFLYKKLSSLWRTLFIKNDIKSDNIEIFHGLSNELPLSIKKCKNTRSIVTMHDLIFLRLPKCYKFFDRKIYNFKYRRSCQNADLIIAVSECTKRDIVELYNIEPEKIKVIYQGCDPIFSIRKNDIEISDARLKYSLPNKYILSVGSIEERKNALTIVKTLPLLPKEIHLVLVGKSTPYTKKIIDFASQNQLLDRLHIFNNVSFNDLPTIYQCAETFIYPSIYEGFGIPILEALNSKIPVIGATGSCLEEAGGPSSIYVNPYDVENMAKAIAQTFDNNNRQKMIEDGYKWALNFSQEKLALQTIKYYNELLIK